MKRLVPCLLLALAGCGGYSPEPDEFVLSPVDGATVAVAETVKLERPAVASYLDRPQMVSRQGDEVASDEMRRWASPLDRMIGDILATDLRQRLPQSNVVTERDDIQPKARFTVDVEINAFNTVDEGQRIEAQLFVKDSFENKNKVCVTQDLPPVSFKANVPVNDETAGLSTLTGQLADRIANLLVSRLSEGRRCGEAAPE